MARNATVQAHAVTVANGGGDVVSGLVGSVVFYPAVPATGATPARAASFVFGSAMGAGSRTVARASKGSKYATSVRTNSAETAAILTSWGIATDADRESVESSAPFRAFRADMTAGSVAPFVGTIATLPLVTVAGKRTRASVRIASDDARALATLARLLK